MNFTEVTSLDEFNRLVQEEAGALFYFSHDACNVCKVLKPKIMDLFADQFPKIGRYYVNTETTPEVSAQLSIFAVPTIILYLDGREYVRESRNVSMEKLAQQVQRPYDMMFEIDEA
jgi:thioredoxin-like negative regulator of GroEL